MATYTGIGFDATNAKIVKPTSSDTVSNAGSASIGGTLAVTGNASVGGNLTVTGDIISGGSTDVVIKDQMIDLGIGATAPQVTGFSFSVDQGTTATSFSAINSGTNRVTVTSSTGFSANDIIVINGSSDSANDGLFYIASVVDGTTIEISTTALVKAPFLQTAFASTTSGESSNQLAQVNLKVLAVADGTTLLDSSSSPYSAGTFVQAYYADAISTDFTADGGYSKLVPDAVATSLQGAYNNGATITTAGNNPIAFTLASGGFNVIGGGAVDLGNTTALSSFNVDSSGAITLDGASASNFTVASANLTLATTTSGTLAVSSAGALDMDGTVVTLDGSTSVAVSSAGALDVDSSGILSLNSSANVINIGNDDVDQAINIGTNGERTLNIGNNFAQPNGTVKVSAPTVDIDATTLTIDAKDGGSIAIGTSTDSSSDTSPINIGTSATARTITIGNDASTKVDLNALDIQLDSAGTMGLDSVGAMTITAGAASTWSTSAGLLTLSGASGITNTSTGGQYTVTATGQKAQINSGDDSQFQISTTTGGVAKTLTLSSTASGAGSSGNVNVTAGAGSSGNAGGIITLNSQFVGSGNGVVKAQIAGTDKFIVKNNGVSMLQATVGSVSVSVGNVVAIGTSGGDAGKIVQADSTNYQKVIGFAMETASSPNTVNVAQTGLLTGLSSLTAGATYYLGTNGAITTTAPTASGTVVFQVGYAISTTSLAIQLQFIIQNP